MIAVLVTLGGVVILSGLILAIVEVIEPDK